MKIEVLKSIGGGPMVTMTAETEVEHWALGVLMDKGVNVSSSRHSPTPLSPHNTMTIAPKK